MKIRNMAVAAALLVGLCQLTGAASAQSKIFVVDESKVRNESKVGQDIASKLAGIKSGLPQGQAAGKAPASTGAST